MNFMMGRFLLVLVLGILMWCVLMFLLVKCFWIFFVVLVSLG